VVPAWLTDGHTVSGRTPATTTVDLLGDVSSFCRASDSFALRVVNNATITATAENTAVTTVQVNGFFHQFTYLIPAQLQRHGLPVKEEDYRSLPDTHNRLYYRTMSRNPDSWGQLARFWFQLWRLPTLEAIDRVPCRPAPYSRVVRDGECSAKDTLICRKSGLSEPGCTAQRLILSGSAF
jgi:hypothetical protein